MSRPLKGNAPLLAALLAACLTTGCGDDAVEPVPPPAPVPTTITITPASATLQSLGESVQLAATVQDQNGQTMAGTTVAWTSGDPSVATVNVSGSVTAVANGTATVTATAGPASASAAVTVDQVLAAVVVEPATDTLLAFGDTLRLSAEAVDANGHAVAVAELGWVSGDTLVAIVDQQGLVTGVSAGEVEVTASSGEVTGRAQLAVLAPAPTALAISPDTVGFDALGQTTRLVAEVRDQAGRTMEGVAVSWSSGDTMVALVDSAGLVTAAGPGTTTIAATADSASGEASVTVMQSAGSVVLSPTTDTIAPGDTLRLGAKAFDGNGHVIDATEFDWSSSNISVVRVDASGLATGLGEGMATVTAVAGDVQGTAEITVENPDRAVLVALYNATDGPNWVNSENWLSGEPIGNWEGVTVDADNRVTRLFLWSTNLRGTIPPELGRLGNLTFLNIGANALTGPIPRTIGNLAQLEEAYFQYNDLSGPVPDALGRLARLRMLSLNGNTFAGNVPESVLRLPRIESLKLTANDLSGVIDWNPEWRSPLTELLIDDTGLCIAPRRSTDAWLEGIRFKGARCTTDKVHRHALGKLFEATDGPSWTRNTNWATAAPLDTWFGVSATSDVVEAIDLRANGLGGRMPRQITAMAQLVSLDLSGNRIEGGMPDGMSDLLSLIRLRVNDNPLTGFLPLELTDLRLRRLDYSHTDLCTPGEPEMERWLASVDSLATSGIRCESVSVSVSSAPSNGGLAEGAGEWQRIPGSSTTTTLLAEPNPGYDFDGWIDDGDTISTDSIHVMEVSADHVVTARFSVNQERGKWSPGGTYTWYRFEAGDYAVDSLSWTFVAVIDPPESLADKGLLHYYAMNFGVANSTAKVGRGYSGLQSNGLIHGRQWGKSINYSIWGSNGGRTDGQLNEDNTECKCHQILYPFPWEEGKAYRFVLGEGPSGTDGEGKWWGLWMTDIATGVRTFIGEQRVPTVIEGRPSATLSPRGIHVFGEDLYWWRALSGSERYVCSDFEPSSVAILDVRAGGRKAIGITNIVNGGKTSTHSNGHITVNCHVTILDGGQGAVQHNLGFWPEPPESVVRGSRSLTPPKP